MSRGPGRLQRGLLAIICSSVKPIAFDEIRIRVLLVAPNPELGLPPSLERSLRRALKKMVDDRAVLALGKGGPADPQRYCFNPLIAAINGNEEELKRYSATLEAGLSPRICGNGT